MKITAISPFNSASALSIVQLVSDIDSGLVILPGYAVNTPSVAAIRKMLKPGVFVFLESSGKAKTGPASKLGRTPSFVSLDQVIRMPGQVFESTPKRKELRDLEAHFPKRTFLIDGRQVSFILCGEINAFQPDGTTKKGVELPFDILVNPAHSVMGRWNVLHPKLAALSKKRVVIHVANNTKDRPKLTTDVRIYANGEMVGSKEKHTYAVSLNYEA
ncbi:hypothetical protein [Pseudomonas gingeri]